MTVLYLILFIAALVCFLIAAASMSMRGRASRVNFVALGLAAWVLVPSIQAIVHLSK